MDLTLYISNVGDSKENYKNSSPSLHIFTPITPTTTYYFWAIGRTVKLEDKELNEQLQQGFTYVFENEDKPVIAAQQDFMGTPDLWSLNPVLLPGDGGGVRARRVLETLIKTEVKNKSPD